MVTQDTTSKFLLGCLVSIYITEEVANYLGDCYVCRRPVELGQIGVYDWQRVLILHPIVRSQRVDCVSLYQQQYLIDHPGTTNTQLMIMFSISESTAKRRRAGVKNGTQ